MEQQLDNLVTSFERGHIDRRGLLAALAAIIVMPSSVHASAFSASILDHVSLAVSDVGKSRAFYEVVLGMPVTRVRDVGAEFDFGRGRVGLYNNLGDIPKIHHFCVSMNDFEVNDAAEALNGQGIETYIQPDSPEQIYIGDPDGIIVQLKQQA